MKSLVGCLVAAMTCTLAVGSAFAQDAAVAGQATAEAKAPAAARASPASGSAKRISVEFRGNLRDALKQIASKGGLNLVVTGKLDQDAEVYLKDVTATEALASVAEAYELKLEQKGKIWTLRPLTAEEKALVPSSPVVAPLAVAPIPPEPPEPAEAPEAPEPPDAVHDQHADADERATREAERAMRRSEAKLREAERHLRQSEVRARVQEQIASRMSRLKNHGDDDMVITGGSGVVQEGESVEDVVVYGGSLKVLGHVNGDIAVFGGSVHLGPKAVVEGDITTFGGSFTRDEGAVVEGEFLTMNGRNVGKLLAGAPFMGPLHVNINGDDAKEKPQKKINRTVSRALPTFLLHFAVLFGLGFLFNIFAPARMKEVTSELVKDPMRCGLTGFVSLLALVPLTVLMAITVVGIIPAILLWVVVIVGIFVGLSVVASEIGLRLPVMQGRKTQAVILALGVLVVLLVRSIPVLGFVAVVAFALLGFGAIVRTRFGNKPRGFPEPV